MHLVPVQKFCRQISKFHCPSNQCGILLASDRGQNGDFLHKIPHFACAMDIYQEIESVVFVFDRLLSKEEDSWEVGTTN